MSPTVSPTVKVPLPSPSVALGENAVRFSSSVGTGPVGGKSSIVFLPFYSVPPASQYFIFPLLLRSFVRGLSLSQSAVLGVGGGIGGRDAGKEARRGPIFGKGTERNELSDASPRSSSPGLSFSSTTTVFLSFIRPFVRFLSHENTAAKRIG